MDLFIRGKMKEIKLIASKDNIRLDLYISQNIQDVSRTTIKKLINEGMILLNGKVDKSKTIVKLGDTIEIKIPNKKNTDIIAQNIKLDIIYEDDYILAVNKPQGMVVHPAPGSEDETLVNALLNYTDKLSCINEQRRGIVHRLDKDTSGIVICAKNDETHLKLVEMFAQRKLIKKYYAVCNGIFNKHNGYIDAPIGRSQQDRKKMTVTTKNSKNALTEYKIISQSNRYALVDLTLHTGRTHQLRVHLKHINHPIVGDMKYGLKNEKTNLNGQLLHAYHVEFIHPILNKKMNLYAKLPKYFIEFIKEKNLKWDNKKS